MIGNAKFNLVITSKLHDKGRTTSVSFIEVLKEGGNSHNMSLWHFTIQVFPYWASSCIVKFDPLRSK